MVSEWLLLLLLLLMLNIFAYINCRTNQPPFYMTTDWAWEIEENAPIGKNKFAKDSSPKIYKDHAFLV